MRHMIRPAAMLLSPQSHPKCTVLAAFGRPPAYLAAVMQPEVRAMIRLAIFSLLLIGAFAQESQVLSLPPDSPRLVLQGQTQVTEYLGRKALRIDAGGAGVKDFEMQDGVIDV